MDNLSTGDILIYSGNNFFQNAVKIIAMSKYNHVSVVIRIDESSLPDIKILPDGGNLYTLDTKANLLDVLAPPYGFKLKKFDGSAKIFYRKIHNKYKTPEFYQKIANCIKKYTQYIYENDKVLNKIRNIFGSNSENPELLINHNGFIESYRASFCSSMTLSFYNYILNLNLSNTVTLPGHFITDSYNHIFDNSIILDNTSNNSSTLSIITIILVLLIILIAIYFYVRKRWKT